MDWTRELMLREQEKKITFSSDKLDTFRFYSIHGIYKVTYAPTEVRTRFIVQGPNYSKTWQKPWHVRVKLTIRMYFARHYPYGILRKYYYDFSNEAPNKAIIDYYRRSDADTSCAEGSLITTKITFKIISSKGVPNSNMAELIQQFPYCPNIRLIVDNRTIDVRKEILIEHSSVFKELLTKESLESEIELKDVDYHEFIVFLAVLHGFYHPNIDHVFLDFLFRLSYKYQVSLVKDKCLEYINHLEPHDLSAFLLLADNYDDATVVLAAIESIKSQQQHYAVLTSPEFKQLKLETRKRILMKETSKQTSKGIVPTSKQKKFKWYCG